MEKGGDLILVDLNLQYWSAIVGVGVNIPGGAGMWLMAALGTPTIAPSFQVWYSPI